MRPGANLGRYVLLEEVGSGGMGVVMAAYDRELGRKVALKLLRPNLSRSGEIRMRREAQSLAQLQHPSVVTVFEVGTIEGQLFIAMEYVEGQTFDQWAARHRGQWRKIVEVAIKAGRGLAAAHAVGLVHRDIKPSNILVGRDGRVCVADFGIATATGQVAEVDAVEARPRDDVALANETAEVRSASLALVSSSVQVERADGFTEAGTVVGTPAYMAPEQHLGQPVDARSDQFAFCVALHRVLYEQAPFAGEDLEELRASVLAGKVEPAPAVSIVPAAVRRVLLRGMAVAPERRWPSMTALLDALERAHGRRRALRMTALATATLGVGSVVALALVPDAPTARASCPSAEQRLRGVWDDERMATMREAFESSDLPYAADAWTHTVQRLDRQAQSWSERYREVCARMEAEGGSPALDLEMACLRTRREELQALVELLVGGEPEVVAKATQAAAELAPVASCHHEGVEAAAMASPAPQQQPEVDEIRLTLARAEAAFKAGTYDIGIEHAEQALERARRVGYTPVEAEALYRLGTLQALAGQLDAAMESLGDASLRAVEVRHDRIAVLAASRAAFVTGYQRGRVDEGMAWVRHASAALERLGPDPLLAADLRINRAALYSVSGQFEAALEEFRAGLEQRKEALGEDHPTVASAYNNLATALLELGRFEEALEALEQARSIWQRSYGPRHPVVATAINGIGATLEHMGRFAQARAQLEQALAIRIELFGEDHVNVAITLDNLGSVLLNLGEYDQARSASQRALDLRAKHLGTRHPHYASSLVNLGLAAEMQGRLDEACTLHRQAIEVWEETLGPDHPYLGHPLTSLGRAELQLGHREEAKARLERALRIREAAANKASELAETRVALGDALWPDEPHRAWELVDQAAAGLHTAANVPEPIRAKVASWLEQHPRPSP
ncbi:serine/threonine-protein kinase [Paraliomyxa miuraensis]|uniref:serine/threonine-protein kinase n=1 Tax=Paraliomyxa miuraensis TaxID=376150 RepID=UPI00224D923F|nr:serine/threonine-protein kinase [Paraliomyxa miuraensis]MCX4243781.1 serine/threonine-protein kinase [Paraliomyxa miuraensis]